MQAGYEPIPKVKSDDEMMERICKYWQIHGRTTPICNDWDLYHELKTISHSVGVEFWLMVGIAYWESHIWINFSPSADCGLSNNRAGIKNNFERERNYRQGCRLHQYDNIQWFWLDFAKILKRGYIDKDCKTASCISRRWVRWDGWLDWKQGWINRVNLFVM